MAGEDAFGCDHACQVVGVGLPTDEHALAAFGCCSNGCIGGEYRLAHGSAGGCVQTAGQNVIGSILVELGMEQLVELFGADALDGFLLGDQALFDHLDGDADGSGCGALAHAGLQHVQLALLDGEFDVAHVAEVVFQKGEDAFQLLAGFFQAGVLLQFCNRAGVADTCDDVLALGVDQVVAVEFLPAVSRVAGEGHAGSGGLALVAEDHGLHVDCGAQVVGDLVLLAVQGGAGVVPAAENGFDCQLQLDAGILGEDGHAILGQVGICSGIDCVGEDLLELRNQLLQVLCGQVDVALDAANRLHRGDGVFEQVAIKTHDDVGEHLDETAIGVPSEALVAGLLDQAIDGLVVQTQVEDGVHHAGHGQRSTGADGYQQGILCIADLLTQAVFQVNAVFLDGFEGAFGPLVAGIGILHASLAGDGESGRHGQADVSHLGQVRALAAKDGLHAGVAFGNVIAGSILAECIHALNYFSHFSFSLDMNSLNDRASAAN